MKITKLALIVAAIFSLNVFAKDQAAATTTKTTTKTKQQYKDMKCYGPLGWGFDVGGQYTWMSLDPDLNGSTGGATVKITYQKPKFVYGQMRTVFNAGTINGEAFIADVKSNDNEYYLEFVGGYTFSAGNHCLLTPYGGLGMDFLNNRNKFVFNFPDLNLNFQSYYAIFGLEFRYSLQKWYFSIQAEGLPIYQQYVTLSGTNGFSWKLNSNVGTAVRLSFARELGKHFWLELTPYYKYFPIGDNHLFGSADLRWNQVGAVLTLRYFI